MICLIPVISEAQIYYAVTTLSGSQTISGHTVTVSQIGTPTSGILCGISPYYVQTGGYDYVFANPVYRIRIHFVAINNDDTVKMKINGTHYNIALSNLSNFTACTAGPMNAFILNGNIVGIGTGTNGVQFDTYVPTGIDSIAVYQDNSGSGWIYNFAFAGACPGNVVASSNHDSLCIGNNLNLMATASSVSSSVSYSWTGPGFPSPSSSQNPTINNVTLSTAGTYVVTANDTGGCVYTDSKYITIIPPPSTISISSNSPVCTGDSLHLYGLDSNVAGYSWTGPGAFSVSTQNPFRTPFVFNDTGYYILTGTNYCGSVSDSTYVISKNPSDPSIIYNSPACTNQTLSLSANSNTSGVSYVWNGPNFNVPGPNTSRPNLTLSDSGYYKVTVSAGNCSTADSVFVHILPTPAVPTVGSNSPVCAGDTLSLSASSASPGVTYHWSGPSSFSPTIPNPVIYNVSSNNTGVYTAIVTLNGCSDSASTSVVINPIVGPPIVSINATPGTTLCLGSLVSFSATASNAGTAAYQWKINGVNVVGGNGSSFNSTTLNNGDIITCRVTGNLSCQPIDTDISNSMHMNMISLSPPAVSLTVNTSASFINFTGNITGGPTGYKFKWTKNGVFIPGQNSYIFSSSNLSPNDSICLIVYDTVACTFPDSSVACYKVATGVNNIVSSLEGINVYPNPINNELIIDGAEKGDIVVLLNIIGQEIYKKQLADKKEIINTHDLGKGNYLLEIINSQGEKIVRKVTK